MKKNTYLINFDVDLGMEYVLKTSTKERIKLELVELENRINLLTFAKYNLSVDFGQIREEIALSSVGVRVPLMGKIHITTLVDAENDREALGIINKKVMYDDEWVNYDWLDELGIDCTKYDVKGVEIYSFLPDNKEDKNDYVHLTFTHADWKYTKKQQRELEKSSQRIDKIREHINEHEHTQDVFVICEFGEHADDIINSYLYKDINNAKLAMSRLAKKYNTTVEENFILSGGLPYLHNNRAFTWKAQIDVRFKEWFTIIEFGESADVCGTLIREFTETKKEIITEFRNTFEEEFDDEVLTNMVLDLTDTNNADYYAEYATKFSIIHFDKIEDYVPPTNLKQDIYIICEFEPSKKPSVDTMTNYWLFKQEDKAKDKMFELANKHNTVVNKYKDDNGCYIPSYADNLLPLYNGRAFIWKKQINHTMVNDFYGCIAFGNEYDICGEWINNFASSKEELLTSLTKELIERYVDDTDNSMLGNMRDNGIVELSTDSQEDYIKNTVINSLSENDIYNGLNDWIKSKFYIVHFDVISDDDDVDNTNKVPFVNQQEVQNVDTDSNDLMDSLISVIKNSELSVIPNENIIVVKLPNGNKFHIVGNIN